MTTSAVSYDAVLRFHQESPVQARVSQALQTCCTSLTKEISMQPKKTDPFKRSVDALSIILEQLSDVTKTRQPLVTPWYEKKIATWTFSTAGIVALLFYTGVTIYDQVWQNKTQFNVPVRSDTLMTLIIITTLFLAIHTVLGMIRTKKGEDRQEALEQKLAEQRETTDHLILSAKALRDYYHEDDSNNRRLHLKRFCNHFMELPTDLLENSPEIGQIVGGLIQRLPRNDPLRKRLVQMAQVSSDTGSTHFLKTDQLDKSSSNAKSSSTSVSPNKSLSELWKKLDKLLAPIKLDSINYGNVNIKRPHTADTSIEIPSDISNDG